MMRITIDPSYMVSGPPWICACGRDLDADAIDSHLVDHLRDRLEVIDGRHHCADPTLRRWLAWRWTRFRAWLRR